MKRENDNEDRVLSLEMQKRKDDSHIILSIKM